MRAFHFSSGSAIVALASGIVACSANQAPPAAPAISAGQQPTSTHAAGPASAENAQTKDPGMREAKAIQLETFGEYEG